MTINAPDTTTKICLECNRQFTGIVDACPHDGTPLMQMQQDPLIGSVLDGSYEILSMIGQGGMGVVYKGRQRLMDRIVAIKVLKGGLVSDSMSVKRFLQEGKASGRIDHPHAISVYTNGISKDGLPYIVMDYLEGSSLSDVIKQEDHVAVERAVRIIMQACEALAHAHKQGVVHRDLKPSNIILTKYDGDADFVKVVDFGVAKLTGGASEGSQKLTQTGEVCGSPVYMSPEQCLGQELDLRSDIYSMGILIYETLTGKLPLLGRTMVDTMSKHVSEMPAPFAKIRPDLYIPERIEQVVFKAMAKDVNKRHQSMDELREDLENAIPRAASKSNLRTTKSFAVAELESPINSAVNKNSIILLTVVTAAFFASIVTVFSLVHNGTFTPKMPTASMTPVDVTRGHTSTTESKSSIVPSDKGGTSATAANTEPEETKKEDAKKPELMHAASPAVQTVPTPPASQPRHKNEQQNAFTPHHKTVGELVAPAPHEHKIVHKTLPHEVPKKHAPAKVAPEKDVWKPLEKINATRIKKDEQ